MKRAIILMLDSLGIGSTKDAYKFGDSGANTLGHIMEHCAKGECDDGSRCGELNIPHLTELGLVEAMGLAVEGSRCANTSSFASAYGCAEELSTGKDTPSGHWEMAGVPVLFDWGYFPEATESFPEELLNKIVEKANLDGYLANCHSSGTVVLDDFGEEHIRTGKPIFYTSADSVFQVACHEESFGLDRLLELCSIIREELDEYNIGRVIARPFLGDKQGEFYRTGNRRDFSMQPPEKTVLDKLSDEKDLQVLSIGKVADIYAHSGITKKKKATGLAELFDVTLSSMDEEKESGVIFTNFVDFDSEFGHRRDVTGYAKALEYFDQRLPELLDKLEKEDLLIITADHGCDPTFKGSDHTRECVPVIAFGTMVSPGNIGRRESFADIGQSLATFFETTPMTYGSSFLF